MSPSPVGFVLIFLMTLPLLARLASGALGGFVTPIIVLLAIPLADALLGRDPVNPEPEHEGALAAGRGFHLVLWAAAPLQLAVTLMGLEAVSRHALSGRQLLDLVLSIGLLSGTIGITVAHELVHRASRAERALGFGLLALVGYMHWGIEHVHGHHKWVATPRDPATSRRGETFYAFLPRALAGELRGAIQIERGRLARRGLPFPSTQNRLLWFAAVELGLLAAFAAVFGARAALVWLASSFVAVALLQVINYVEHYGLVRRPTAQGHYEKVGPQHSWDASEWLSNKLLFNLQRHADHHAHAARPYQLLRLHEETPRLPTGYAGMLLLALVPPLWFRVMDRRLPEEDPAPAIG